MSWGTYHHTGILVKSREQAIRIVWHYRLFGMADIHPWVGPGDSGLQADLVLPWEPVPKFDCECCFLREHPTIELVHPFGGVLTKFFSKNETALHHVAFEVPDIRVLPLDPLFKTAVKGANNLLVNFFQPFEGVLVEAVQKNLSRVI